jgi:hypothetical protein
MQGRYHASYTGTPIAFLLRAQHVQVHGYGEIVTRMR